MASDELTDFLIETVEEAFGPTSTRKMFGGTGIWKNELFVAMIADDLLLIRLDEANEAEYIKAGFVPNDPSSAGKGRKRYYEVPADIIEDSSLLEAWLERSLDAAASSEA